MNQHDSASLLLRKIQKYLLLDHGKRLFNASIEEFYHSFCTALKEEIMLHWTASSLSRKKKKPRSIFYLSMEYLPGRFIDNNILHIGAQSLVQEVLTKTPYTMRDLVEIEPDPGLGNGGLGRLASCFLDSLAAMALPAFGYGLRYQYGIFEQEMVEGVQMERPDRWLVRQNPWEFRRDEMGYYVHYEGLVQKTKEGLDKLEDAEEVRAIPYDYPIVGFPSREKAFSVITMRLWSTKESPRNFAMQKYNAGEFGRAGENTSLTDVLYPSDHHEEGKRVRLKQEFLLVSASLQDLLKQHLALHETLDNIADKIRIQINDTHPGLVIPELVRLLREKNPALPIEEAFEKVRCMCSYTNHTVLKEALEEWNEERLMHLLPRQYAILQQLNFAFCKEVRKHFPEDTQKTQELSIIQNRQVKMAPLLIYGCSHVNGVAKLHTKILQNHLFKDFSSMYPEKFYNVTNGVSHRKWLLEANPELSSFLTKKIGDEWIYDFAKIGEIKKYADDKKTQEEFLAVKKQKKEQLLVFLEEERARLEKKTGKNPYSLLREDALFCVQIKRIHEYKRQLLYLLHVLCLYLEMRENHKQRSTKRLMLLAGKAAPGYANAKYILHFAYILARKINHDPKTKERLQLVFVENYNVSKTLMIIPGADLSEQISLAGKEASGTGNMKLSMNGALTIGTNDGANVEMREEVGKEHWPFLFGLEASEVRKKRKTYQPKSLYEKDPLLKKLLDFMVSNELTDHPAEKQCLSHLRKTLLEGDYEQMPDEYFVLEDFRSYYQAQEKVEELFQDKAAWAKLAIHNLGSMGFFTSDRSVGEYIKRAWHITPCGVDPEIWQMLLQEFPEFNVR